jgi:predicted amidohydrolase
MRIALVQMLVEGGKPEQNLDRASCRIEEAANNGAQLVLLPEALDLGWTHSSASRLASPVPEGAPFRQLASAAVSQGVHVCAGLVERDGEQLFNSAVLIGPDGKPLIRHRKINELEIALDLYTPGDTVAPVCETELGRIGLEICADGFAENQWISRELCSQGAELILAPSAWAVEANFDPAKPPYGAIWRENFGPVARECSVWIVACSNVGQIEEGPWRGRKCIGNSLAFDPNGNEVLTGPFGEDADTILYLDVEIRK